MHNHCKRTNQPIGMKFGIVIWGGCDGYYLIKFELLFFWSIYLFFFFSLCMITEIERAAWLVVIQFDMSTYVEYSMVIA